jgi:malonyl CoA-acyl carrier protein transacylase
MTALRRAAVVLPGRGSYTSASLGTLPGEHPLVAAAEELRAGYGLGSLRELDAAERFDPSLHLRPVNASPLIYLASLLDAELAAADHRIVVAAGNSLGWYTALALSGALSFAEGFRLVQELAILQEEAADSIGGGQVIYPLSGPDWQPDATLGAVVAAALRDDPAAAGRVFESIELGPYAVLAGDDTGVARLLRELPPLRIGERIYPLRLALHGPYHTPLLAGVAEAAGARLADLAWQAPAIPIVDGFGRRWTPFGTDPAALAAYTLGPQITSPYRFATSLRVALREYGPDLLVLTGPGNSLGGVCGQLVVREGYRGLRTRADLERAQAGAQPVLLSMRR